jgi:pantoate--beta-alanine ligase
MKIVKTIQEVRECISEWRRDGLRVGFVPTMGYLHEGHQSLINRAAENDRIVLSIFVNPMQFGQNEDLASYPRDLERDSRLCEENGVDLIFYPEPEEMYGADFCSYVDMHVLTEELCGLSRPVHFRGVCTVVLKLFNIVAPDRAYFGEKDAQQLAIIKRMVRDLNINVEVIGCPTVREMDGLAKSSRNTYLNTEERKAALVLYGGIQIGKKLIKDGERDAVALIKEIKGYIEKEPLAKIDYLKAVDAMTMSQVEKLDRRVLVAMAVFIGKTRLIDNFTFDFEDETINYQKGNGPKD